MRLQCCKLLLLVYCSLKKVTSLGHHPYYGEAPNDTIYIHIYTLLYCQHINRLNTHKFGIENLTIYIM